MERLFFRLSELLFGPALVIAVVCLIDGNTEAGAAIGIAVSTASLVYWVAFYVRYELPTNRR